MNLEQTRLLGIEFERRVQTMIPETEMVSKLDTETIYSYLNQFQDQYIHELYKALDNIPTPSKPSEYIETILADLLRHVTLSSNQNKEVNNMKVYDYLLPKDFGLYANSSTSVSESYEYKTDEKHSGELPSSLVAFSKLHTIVGRPQDSMRIIREPIVYINYPRTITAIYDRYTKPEQFNLSYYKLPQYMDLFTQTPCELPMEAFEDLVTGAANLYVQYVAGAEARKRQMQEQQKRNNKEGE